MARVVDETGVKAAGRRELFAPLFMALAPYTRVQHAPSIHFKTPKIATIIVDAAFVQNLLYAHKS